MRKNIWFIIIFVFCHIQLISQQYNIVKDYYKEDFVVRAFEYSRQHYFARLSYNNQTIYITNILHPHKSVAIVSSKNSGVKTMAFTEDENYLVSGTNEGHIEVWDINKRILHRRMSYHSKAVNKVQVLSGSSLMVTAGNDGKIFLCDFNKQSPPSLIGSHEGIVRDFDISDDENFMVSIGSDNKLILWNLKKKIKLQTLIISPPSSVKFASSSNTILVGNLEGELLYFDYKLTFKKSISIHESVITSICKTSENNIVTGSFDGTIKKIDLSDFSVTELYSDKAYIIHIATLKHKLTLSKQNGELISIVHKL